MAQFEPEEKRSKSRRRKALEKALVSSLDSGLSDYEIYDDDIFNQNFHQVSEQTPPVWNKISTFPKRYILVILTFGGMFVMTAFTMCMSVAIVAMTTNTTYVADGEEITKVGVFLLWCNREGIIPLSLFHGCSPCGITFIGG